MATCTVTINHTNRPAGQPDQCSLTVTNTDGSASVVLLTACAHFSAPNKTQNTISIPLPLNTAYAEGALGAGTGALGVGSGNLLSGTYGTLITHGVAVSLPFSIVSMSGTLQVELSYAVISADATSAYLENVTATATIAPT